MPNKFEKQSAKRGKATYIYSILGVALVLFFLGLLGMIVINADQLSKKLKERLEIQVMMKPDVDSLQTLEFAKQIRENPKVLEVVFVHKDDAAREMQAESANDDFISVLGFNPLGHSLNVNVKSEYVEVDSLAQISQQLSSNPQVDAVNYNKEAASSISDWIRKIGIGLAIFSALLVLSVIVLIDNTIRLAMFSNRFIVKTMQMVGATQSFIAKPFVTVGIRNGLISGILAVLGILGIRQVILQRYPEFQSVQNDQILTILLISIVILGVFITYISTRRSVTKYLKTSLDDLY